MAGLPSARDDPAALLAEAGRAFQQAAQLYMARPGGAVAVPQQADVEQQGVAPRPAPLSAGARQPSPSVALRQREPTPAPSCARARAQRAHGGGSPRLPPPSPPRVPRGPSARRDAASAPAERAKRDEDTALAKAYLRRVREEVDTPAPGGGVHRQAGEVAIPAAGHAQLQGRPPPTHLAGAPGLADDCCSAFAAALALGKCGALRGRASWRRACTPPAQAPP